ncbi:C2 domain protein (macronuclear) [Tetrahymena thermophila SB210]|uniref:C2 domain protein n=1 Tax=Tetrahymena thermophila (strain SB210) TaxID=312017 RepID=W7X7I6_TETTS|nr:C2 domain protein [Tetrahymena thermophila SB210]EWS72343.1 C2 domain protein [Tetrahymena thermophila SB210]|eukprot:XP_012655120.1 C2 domain protein [Tetrahymena thermophila SB210]
MNVSNLKAVVYGDPKSGKKSLIKQLSNKNGQLVIEDKVVNAQYIFEFQINNFEPDEDTICLIYVVDLTKAESLDDIQTKYYSKINKDYIPIKNISILVGNKVDREDDRQIDKDDLQTYAVDNGMLVNEVSCINNGSNIEALIRQITNKAKLLLKNQQKRVPAGNSKSPRTLRENIMITQKNTEKSQDQVQVDANQTLQKPSQVNTSQINNVIIKPKEVNDIRKEQRDVEKNRASNGDIDGSSSPQRKKFDFKDKLKQFTKKKDDQDDPSVCLEEKKEVIIASQKDMKDVKQGLKKVEVNKINNIPKQQEQNSSNNNKNEFLNKFQKITQKNDQTQPQDSNTSKIESNQFLQRDRQTSFKGQEQKPTTAVTSQIKKFENVEQPQKQESKTSSSRSSVVKRNSILHNNEQSSQNSNRRNSINQNGKINTADNDSKSMVTGNKLGNDQKNNNYNSKEDDKKNILLPSSNNSQRSEQNNSNGGQSLIESMYKNRLSISNKIPPSATNGKHEVKNVVKFQDEVVENKRKQSDITGSKSLVKDSTQSKSNIQEDQSKKKLSPLELLKMKPENNTNSNKLSTQHTNQKKESENQQQEQNEKSLNSKSVENQKIHEANNQKQQIDLITQKNQSDSIEQNIRKTSFQKTQPNQKTELLVNQTDEKQKIAKLASLEEGENQGRPLPQPQINILQCSSSPKQKQENAYLNLVGGVSDQNSAKKSSNSLNEYLENENLVNNQLSLLNELATQIQSQNNGAARFENNSQTQSQQKQYKEKEDLKQQKTEDLQLKNQANTKQQNNEDFKQNNKQELNSQQQFQLPLQFKTKENQLYKSEYSEKGAQDNEKNDNQVNEAEYQNVFQYLKIYESTVINQNNPVFYRASFENVPNIMNPSSNESSMINPQTEKEEQSHKETKQEDVQNEQQVQNQIQKSTGQPLNEIKQIIDNKQITDMNIFDSNFNSFNIKDSSANKQLNNHSQNSQSYFQKFNQFRQNQFNQQSNEDQQNQIENLEQFQSFQNKQDVVYQNKQDTAIQSKQDTAFENKQQNLQANNYNISQQPQIQLQNQIIQAQNEIKQKQLINDSQLISKQQNGYLVQQQGLENFQNTQLNQIQIQQQQQMPLQNKFQNNLIFQQSNLSPNQQPSLVSQNNINNLNQSPPLYQQQQISENLLGQFGSQGTINHNSLSQAGNLSFQQHMSQQSDQDILVQQLLKQLLMNQQYQQNQVTMQLIQQLLQNQQNSIGFSQNAIPSQFSFAQNPNNIQLSPYIQQTQRQQSQQSIVQSPYVNPFEQQSQFNQSNINEILLRQQQIQNQNHLIQLSPISNNLNSNQQLQQINLQKVDGIPDQMQSETYRNYFKNSTQLNEKSKEEQANQSKYNNISELDGKVSRFSIHTNNITPEPNNLSSIGQAYYENNIQYRDNSVLVADIEMKQNNINKFSPHSLTRPNGDLHYNNLHQSDEKQNDFLNIKDQNSQFLNDRDIQNGETRGRNMNQNYFYQQQYKGFPSERYYSHLKQDEILDKSNQRRDVSEGNQKQPFQHLQGNRQHQTREFSNSSHIDELLREVNNISLNKSTLKDKYHGSSISQSQIRSNRNQYGENQQANTSNILLNTTGNLVDKSLDQIQELSKLDKNIKKLEESIEDIDYELLQGRIQQKIKSRREHSNNQDLIREKDTDTLQTEMNDQGVQNTNYSQRVKAQNEKTQNIEKHSHLQMQNIIQSLLNQEDDSFRSSNVLKQKQIITNANIPIYETKLQTSRKSPSKIQQIEDTQIINGKSISRKSIQQNTQRTNRNASVESNIQTSHQTQYLHQQNFSSKKQKSILLLNFEYNNQQFIIDVFGDDTSFQLAERFFSSQNKTATRNQIKKLANIIESIINKYCTNLYDKIQKVEKKSQNFQISKS